MPELRSLYAHWPFPWLLTVALVGSALLYLRGWFGLRDAAVRAIAPWRAGGFLFGVLLIWVAIGSPLALLDEQLLTVHMLQHLLLMTIAPALLLLGAPLVPVLHGLSPRLLRTVVSPLSRQPLAQRAARLVSRPLCCWMAATAAIVVWHIPAVFSLALRSEPWHIVAHISFLLTGLLFWWPVIHPWPSIRVQPQWSILLYLFAATLPCDVLSGFLVFSERVVYPMDPRSPRPFGIAALTDQECAGALMWTAITVIYLVPAAVITTRLLGARHPQTGRWMRPEST